MASINPYPSGSDILAPLPLYTPDFGMMNSMLQRRSSMFEQGLSQVKSSDSLIRNAALSVSDNQVVRDNYIKQAETQLQKLQGADFSQMQNVEAAQQVYAPFWQDQDLLMDYSKTSSINAERTRAESMAQSSDPKVREQYWKTGADYVALSANELSMAKRGDGSIGKVKVNKYVPYFDVMSELKKRAKDQGLQIETDSQEGPNKAYKITRINGDSAVPLFKEWAANELSDMPQADDVFRVQGVVDYRSQVQQYQAQGYEEGAAKKMVADSYMARQKSYFTERQTDLTEQITEMTKKLDAMDVEFKAKQAKGELTAEELGQRKALAGQLEGYKKGTASLQENIDKYSKSDAKEYQDEYNSMLNGGEDFFRRFHKNSMIQNFARNQAINNKYKIDVDPVFKLNREMEITMAKLQQADEQFGIRYGDGTPGSGSGSRSGKKKDEGNPLDAPIYVGRSIMGNDPVEAQQRMQEQFNRTADEYLSTGASIISEAGMQSPDKMVSPAYMQYLSTAVKTGKVTKNDELEKEHKRLQDLGVVPKGYKLGDSPHTLYNMMYDRATEILAAGSKAGTVNPNVFNRIQRHAALANQFTQLAEIHGEVEKKVAADPAFRPLMKDGKVMGLNDYMKNTLGFTNKDAFIKNYTKGLIEVPGQGIPGGSSFGLNIRNAITQAEDRWEQVQEQYNKAYGLVKGKTANLMQRYLNVEGAVIGQEVELVTDRKEDREQAQTIAIQAMSQSNMANQLVDKDGSGYPINIKQLEELGADREKIKQLMDLTRGNIDNFIDKVRMTKVGINGKPSVKLVYNMDEVKKLLGEKKFGSEDWEKTLRTLNNGLELAVDQAQIEGFNQDFDLPGMSDAGFDKNQMLKAPAAVKKFGFDYTVLKDPAAQQYIVTFNYNENGIPKQKTLYPALSNSITSVQKQLEQMMYQIYTGNQQSLQKPGASGNFISPTASYESLIQQ